MAMYVASVGMEVHAELSTRSKMFCRCPVAFGGEPNTRVCPVCLGLPGSLPVPNRAAIEMVVKTALALNCQINLRSEFQRKNYFYPDLPKGYQISQYAHPLGHSGWLDVPAKGGATKRIGIRRVHLEEDTGKLMHLPNGESGVDCNRAGVPLMEIVTEFPPDISDPDEAKEYIVQLRQVLIYLGVCDGKMEEGSLRCEPNVSVRPEGIDRLGTKTELKNLGSFRSVQLGVKFEIDRQVGLLESGQAVHQETRGWNEAKEESFLMRRKETENDYRYFPDPDLTPMVFAEEQIEAIRASLPELPLAKRARYRSLGLANERELDALLIDLDKVHYFERYLALGGEAKEGANWVLNSLSKVANDEGKSLLELSLTPEHLLELIGLYTSGRITRQLAKGVFAVAVESGRRPSDIVEGDPKYRSEPVIPLESLVRQILDANPEVIARYKAGNVNVKGFLVGQVMRQSNGTANPQLVQDLVQEALDKQ